MKRKTNLFYTEGPDSKFLTFSNYTESLTGNFLSTDTKLYPSVFLCLNVNINKDNKKNFINNYLTGYYENKLAALRDYFIENNKKPEDYMSPLGYLLDTIKKFDSNFTITYVGDITEQDYNGTYTDTICTISFANYYKGTYSAETQSELDDNYIDYSENSLYGWKENELVMIQINDNEIICKYQGNGNIPVNLYQDLPNLEYIKIDNNLYNINSSNNPFYKDNDDNDRCYCIFNDYNNHIVRYIFNNNVNSIASDAFYESQLISIILPTSVTLIGQNAFKNCINLISITCNTMTAPIFESGPNTFGNIQNNGILYIHENAIGYNTWMEQLSNGWKEKTMKEKIQLNFDKEYNKYCIKSNINKLKIEKNTNDNPINFNIVIPLFDVTNINYHTQHYINENNEINTSNETIEIDLNNVTSNDLYRKYVPLGIWFADEIITLKKDSNNIFSQSWSLLISSQFKPFPYSNANVNTINENSVSNAYPTFAMVLSRQNDILNKFNEINKQLKNQQEIIKNIKIDLNNTSSVSIDKLNSKIINIEKNVNERIDNLQNTMKEFMNNFIWNTSR